MAIAGAIGSVATLASGSDAKNIGYSTSISSSSRANNREQHPDGQQVLAFASKGKTEEEKQRLLAASVYLVHGDNVNANGLKSPELKRLAELGKGYVREQDQLVKLASGLGYKDAFLYDVTHAGKDFILSNFDVIDRSIEVYDSLSKRTFGEFSDLRAGATAAVSIFPFSRVAGAASVSAKGGSYLNQGNKVKWIDEKAQMSNRAKLYNDSAYGARSNLITKTGQAPSLNYKTPQGIERKVRFDGHEGNILIDRKISVLTTEKAKNQALRQSEALTQNNMRGRWEVPNQVQRNRAEKVFKDLKINNIEVKIINE